MPRACSSAMSYYPTLCKRPDVLAPLTTIEEIPSPTRTRTRRQHVRPGNAAKRLEEDQAAAEDLAEQVCSPQLWEVDPKELHIGECVGSGTSAEVHRANWHGTDVAVKCLRHTGSLPVEFQRELSMMLQLRHPHLVLFMGASAVERPMIVSELCEGGTVFQLLHQRRDVELSWTQRLKIATDTAKGMNFLHRRHFVHRDLKSLNMLLVATVRSVDDVPWTKISDFGLARHLPCLGAGPDAASANLVMTGGLGTCQWMAPEVLCGGPYDERVDVYSYGVVLFELAARCVPFEGAELGMVAVAVSRGYRPELRNIPLECPAQWRAKMEQCWNQSPEERPSFGAVLEALKLVQCA